MEHTDKCERMTHGLEVPAIFKQAGSGANIEPAGIQIPEVLSPRIYNNKTRFNL
jgi:hypothetical protein